VERFRDGEHGPEYQFENDWRPVTVHNEPIEVKGGKTERLQVRETHHGPIVNDALGAKSGEPLALAWTAIREPVVNSTGVDAGGFTAGAELVEAFRGYTIPSMNMVWADSSGNIGYKLVGKLPIRRGGCPDLPKPGWTGEYEWDGYIPYEELPEVTNPPNGMLVTANNRIAPDDYPHHISSEYLDGYRAARIEQLLNEKEKLSLDDFERIQLDLYSIPGERTAHRLARLRPPGQRETRAIERLKSWDHKLDPDTIAGTIYAVFTVHFARLVSEAVIGDEDYAERWRSKSMLGFTPMVSAPWRFQARLIELWDEADPELIGGRSWDDLAIDALTSALDELETQYGSDPNAWTWAGSTACASPTRWPRAPAGRRSSSTGCCRATCRPAARRRPSVRSDSCPMTAPTREAGRTRSASWPTSAIRTAAAGSTRPASPATPAARTTTTCWTTGTRARATSSASRGPIPCS